MLLSLSLLAVIFLIFKHTRNTPYDLNQCSAIITESSDNENIIARFQRVITIADKKGFSRDSGILSEGNEQWHFNRFYTFSLELISGRNYEFKILSYKKSESDNVPDATMKKLRPEYGMDARITRIEKIAPDVWLFSGLSSPLFACKELKRN